MKKFFSLAAIGAAIAVSSSAQAAITISAEAGSGSYAGLYTYDFESPAPVAGGAIRTGSFSGLAAQPLGSTGNYWTISPSDGSPGMMNLANFSAITSIGFIWGSVDNYNWVDVLARDGSVLHTFNGTDVAAAPDGNWTAPGTNPYATITITGADQANIGGLRLRSTGNAFEVDNFAIAAVPEPATWAMLVLGFGTLGGAVRSRTRKAAEARRGLRLA